jgi:hypothetical protein
MSQYFERLPVDAATEIEELSRLAYELRENRRGLLGRHAAEDEAALLHRIVAGELPEHPAYEHYLGALALADARNEVLDELKALLERLGGGR